MEIKIGIKGKILSGEKEGDYVWIYNDEKNTGGYLIFTADNPEMNNAFDGWVEKFEYLPKYFAEAQWTVEWLEKFDLFNQ
ncbi:hypothetical protein [Leptospira neocaledonica]|uniref:Uncharacterized protein n=1 Tax=Leptospira neocaledonica TaxID=2023192 RepID=A0A2M9ZW22_9LEPT|nr:hypothetical protein [Leptospira neocaledonica]PJZ76219.1 hypothetical protein CH365_15475 [Leptospira neocaledonica]